MSSKRALRAFEQHILAGLVGLEQQARHVRHHGLDALRNQQDIIQGFLEIHGFGLEVILQHEVVVIENFAQLGRQALAVEQVLDADAAARHLVFVGGTDAAPGGADLAGTLGGFARLVQGDVMRHDDRAGFGNLQAVAHRHAGLLQHVHFFHQRPGRHHHAVADVAFHLVAQDAGRNQVQHRFGAIDHQRVAGVVAALKAHHALGMIGEPVDDLALAFISPLGADYYYVFCHVIQPLRLDFFNLPLIVAQNQNPIAIQFIALRLMPGQVHYNHFSLAA